MNLSEIDTAIISAYVLGIVALSFWRRRGDDGAGREGVADRRGQVEGVGHF